MGAKTIRVITEPNMMSPLEKQGIELGRREVETYLMGIVGNLDKPLTMILLPVTKE